MRQKMQHLQTEAKQLKSVDSMKSDLESLVGVDGKCHLAKPSVLAAVADCSVPFPLFLHSRLTEENTSLRTSLADSQPLHDENVRLQLQLATLVVLVSFPDRRRKRSAHSPPSRPRRTRCNSWRLCAASWRWRSTTCSAVRRHSKRKTTRWTSAWRPTRVRWLC